MCHSRQRRWPRLAELRGDREERRCTGRRQGLVLPDSVASPRERRTVSARRGRPTSRDARYSEQEGARWSGRPNGRLLVEVGVVARAGRSMSVAARAPTAIWLALSGWTVTAVDVSAVVVGRARMAAELAGAAVEWISGDILQMALPAGSFDLVSMQYPALPKAAGERAMRTLLGTVRPGGLLLAVYHDLDDEHRRI